MNSHSLRILQVSAVDQRGGAALVAWTLHQAYRRLGYEAWMAVGQKLSSDPHVLVIPNEAANAPHVRWLRGVAASWQQQPVRGAFLAGWALQWIAQPRRHWEIWRGHEDFHHKGTWRLLQLTGQTPSVVHGHNLHGGYFDLRALPWLSQRVPVVLTLHDAWLLSGHCAHSFDCDRWKTGCGQCPDLRIYPAIKRDGTAENHRRKQAIYARSRLFVATPCQWLMRKVQESVLAPAIVESKIIPYGLDLALFSPAPSPEVRRRLGIPEDRKVLLFAADGIRQSIWKDYATMRAAVAMVAERLRGMKLLFLALGEQGASEQVGRAEIQFVPYQRDHRQVADYYRAADLYLHAARADTYPNTVLEALACGIPVVATAVGGIPEQVKGLSLAAADGYGPEAATGMIVPPGNAEAMAGAVTRLLEDDSLRQRLAHNATRERVRLDIHRQSAAYLEWYAAMCEQYQSRRNGGRIAA